MLQGVALAVFGAMVASTWFVMASNSRDGIGAVDRLWVFLPLAVAASALTAIYFAMPWLGGRGLLGAARFMVGMAVATILTLGFSVFAVATHPQIGIADAVLAIFETPWGLVPCLWLVGLWICHSYCKLERLERQSLFQVPRPEDEKLLQFSVLSRLALPDAISRQRAKWMGY